MPGNNIAILATREISQILIDEAAEKNITVEVSPFIRIEPIQSVEVQQEIESALLETLTVVFTSANAVEAVAAELEGQKPDWKINCIGHGTKDAVEKYFDKHLVTGVADHATALAELIIEQIEKEEVVFFCGDKHKPELATILEDNGINVTEIVVYQTLLLPHKIEKKYNGILFFSPTAVNSFFQKNKLTEQTVLFAIGETTAGEIRKFSSNRVVLSNEPVKKSLLETAISFFQENPIHH